VPFCKYYRLGPWTEVKADLPLLVPKNQRITPMNRPISFDIREKGRAHRLVWPTITRWLLVFCAAAAVVLLLVAESYLSSEQRQRAFETLEVYP
jgi:hypothetical protein